MEMYVRENLILLLAFMYGATGGSFANVFVGRKLLPNPLKKLCVPSACDSCGTPIRWYQNIPVLSYMVLGGKCAKCGAKIGFEGFLWELIYGLIPLGMFLLSEKNRGLAASIAVGMLVVLTAIRKAIGK